MAADGVTFDQCLGDAEIDRGRLTPDQSALLEAGFRFMCGCEGDYYSRRVLSHFLLRCESGLKVAQIARFVGISRATASKQQHVSSKEMVQVAHHRMAGRPHGKMLPRYAGPIAQFLITHPQASRWDILDFIERTWQVRVSTVALYRFMKKYGLDRAQRSLATAAETEIVTAEGAATTNLPVPEEEFFLPPRSTPGRSSSCRPH
jgi:hypothetical protein